MGNKKGRWRRKKKGAGDTTPTGQQGGEGQQRSSQEKVSVCSSSSVESSPLKVLVDSSNKVKVASSSAKRSVKLEGGMGATPTPALESSDEVVREGLKQFDENMRRNITASGALDLEGFINAGMEDKAGGGGMLVLDSNDEGNKGLWEKPPKQGTAEILEGAAGEGTIQLLDERVEVVPASLVVFRGLNGEYFTRIVPKPPPSAAEQRGNSTLKESESPATESAKSEDNGILREVNVNDTGLPVQYLDVTSNLPSVPLPLDPEGPQRKMREASTSGVTPSAKPKRADGTSRKTARITPDTGSGSNAKKRNNVTSQTLLRPPKLEIPSSSAAAFQQPQGGMLTVDATLQVLQELQRQRQRFAAGQQQQEKPPLPDLCLSETCKKVATVACPTCKRLLYCTERHRKVAKKIHELYCNAYREIESKPLGNHMIAARDIKRACPVITDEPILVLPLNPSLESRAFPQSYCVKCFNNAEVTKVTGSRSCVSKCNLPDCNSLICEPAFSKLARELNVKIPHRVPAHGDFECKILRRAVLEREIGKKYVLICDQSVLGMLRCIGLQLLPKVQFPQEWSQLLDRVKLEPYTKNFESKLKLVRNLLLIGHSTVSDEQLYQIDQALLRYGRNVGRDIVSFQEIHVREAFYVRCIYPKLAHVIHSCVPNSILVVSVNSLSAVTYAVKEIKKGDILSFCYDNRALFMPTRQRQRFLLDQFGFQCKCKRCMSPSDLDTYFSSLPCSKCPKGQGFLVPDNPLDLYSNWMCFRCKKTPVYYLRIVHTTYNLGEELEAMIKKRDPLKLLALLVELVEENCLHWNHHLIFHASVKLFGFLWEALNGNDANVMAAYSKQRGLQFLKPAETVINLTEAFMPDGYSDSYVLPLRLASLIKLRHLTVQLERKETTLEKVNYAINEIYFRAFDLSKSPLHERHLPLGTLAPWAAERHVKVMETRVVKDLVKQAISLHGVSFKVKATGLDKLYIAKQKDHLLFKLIEEYERKPKTGIFPWDLNV